NFFLISGSTVTENLVRPGEHFENDVHSALSLCYFQTRRCSSGVENHETHTARDLYCCDTHAAACAVHPRHERAPAFRRLQVLVLAPPQASERQDRRIHEPGSLSFFSLPDCHA